jgi:hypothetical protein
LTVLERAARTAGTTVAATATPSATAVTSNQARCAADGLEEPDASGLIGHPAADQHRETGHGEQTKQPGSNQQKDLGVSGQLGGVLEDVLPGRQAWSIQALRGVGVDERLGRIRVGQLQVHHVGQGVWVRGQVPHIRLGEPDQSGIP